MPGLLGHAADMELERDHVLGRAVQDEDDIFAAEQDLLARAEAGEGASDELTGSYEALGSEARFDHVLYDGVGLRPRRRGARRLRGGDGLPRHPGAARARPVRALLHSRQSERAKRQKSSASDPDTVREVSTYEQLAVLRRELNGLVAAWHHRTGQAHGITHAALRKECGGPAAAVASADQLHARIDQLRAWAARRTS